MILVYASINILVYIYIDIVYSISVMVSRRNILLCIGIKEADTDLSTVNTEHF